MEGQGGQDAAEQDAISQRQQEIYLLVSMFLEQGPCRRASQLLKEEMEEKGLLPKRIDWQGHQHSQSVDEVVRSQRLPQAYLEELCSATVEIANARHAANVPKPNTIIRRGALSLLPSDLATARDRSSSVRALVSGRPVKNPNVAHRFIAMQRRGRLPLSAAFPSFVYKNFEKLFIAMGHREAVFCLSFDKTGDRICTGADDKNIKIWCTRTGKLLATLRGHEKEIANMDVNSSNTLLATASLDGVIRVWCLKTGTQVAVLIGHRAGSEVCTINFGNNPLTGCEYLISSGKDNTLRFWQFEEDSGSLGGVAFLPFNDLCCFDTRSLNEMGNCPCRGECKCSVFTIDCSPGGAFCATGNTDGSLRIYKIGEGPLPLCVAIEYDHLSQVETVKFSNKGNRILTSSADGTARIWYHTEKWRSHRLHSEVEPKIKGDVSITWGAWTCDDRYVACSELNNKTSHTSVWVWSTQTMKPLHVLRRHENQVIQLVAHPWDPRIVMTGGHDGRVCLWDVVAGACVREIHVTYTRDGSNTIIACLDCNFSPDGFSIAITDAWGHVSMYGFADTRKYARLPYAQFFTSDWSPLIRDANNWVLDADTSLPPNMIPGILCSDGQTAYGEEYQDPRTLADRLHGVVRIAETDENELGAERRKALCREELEQYEKETELEKERLQRQERASRGTRVAPAASPPKVFRRRDHRARTRFRPFSAAEQANTEPIRVSRIQQVRTHSGRITQRVTYDEESQSDFSDEYIARPEEEEAENTDEGEFSGSDDQMGWGRPSRRSQRGRHTSTAAAASAVSIDGADAGEASSPSMSTGATEETSKKSKKKSKKKADYRDFFPSAWISISAPELAPYVPQIGDRVLYFQKGHQNYVSRTLDSGYHVIDMESLPWTQLELAQLETCTIEDIAYVVGPPSIALLTLRLESASHRHESISVAYCDQDNMPEFLVHEPQYKAASHARDWAAGDRFRVVLDGSWYYGAIVENRWSATQEEWCCLEILWEATDAAEESSDTFSPWELHKVMDGEEEPPLATAKPDFSEFPESEQARILGLLRKTLELPVVECWRDPVDFEAFKDYCKRIPYPIDLGTIVRRLENGFYRRKEALLWDFTTMSENTCAFNQPGSLIVETMTYLHEALKDMVSRTDAPEDIEVAYPRLRLASLENGHATDGNGGLGSERKVGEVNGDEYDEEEDVETEEEREARERRARKNGKRKRREQQVDEMSEDCASEEDHGDDFVVKRSSRKSARPERGGSTTSPQQQQQQQQQQRSRGRPPKFYRDQASWDYATPWELRMVQFHNALMARESSAIFNVPVDTSVFTDYLSCIACPMDFGIILDRLASRAYASINDYIKDVELVFSNARAYNHGNKVVVDLVDDVERFFRGSLNNLQVDDLKQLRRFQGMDRLTPELTQEIIKIHRFIMAQPDAEPFNVPVDVRAFPDYRDVIQRPMDLGTVLRGLETRKFKSVEGYAKDARLVFENSLSFNHPGSDIYLNALGLLQQLDANLKNLTGLSAVEAASVGDSQGGASALPSLGEFPKRRVLALHKRLMAYNSAISFFNEPVDRANVAYYLIISNPIDFGTIQDRVQNDVYRTIEEYARDVRQVFVNARAYNEPGCAVYESTIDLNDFFESEIEKIARNVPK